MAVPESSRLHREGHQRRAMCRARATHERRECSETPVTGGVQWRGHRWVKLAMGSSRTCHTSAFVADGLHKCKELWRLHHINEANPNPLP